MTRWKMYYKAFLHVGVIKQGASYGGEHLVPFKNNFTPLFCKSDFSLEIDIRMVYIYEKLQKIKIFDL